MKKLGRIVLIMALFIIALPVFSGCGEQTETELTARKACIEMMQKVPVYYEDFQFWDVGALRDDPDIAEMYRVWYERRVDFLEERYGIDSTRIDYLAQGEGLLDIFIAEYDTEALRGRIAAEFYRNSDYEDIEVWKSEPSHDPQSVTGGWVLAEGLLVRGANNFNVDDYLRVVNGEELSMYDKNAAGLLERLPQGLMIRVIRSSYPEGLIVSGMSVVKDAKGIYRWVNVYKFESSEAAQSPEVHENFQSIEDEFDDGQSIFAERGESAPFSSFTLKQEGEFVEWSVLIEEQYMIAMLFYG